MLFRSGSTGPVDPDTTASSTGGESSSTGDGTTGEDPNFGQIPETCEQSELSQSTVGCLFYGVDLDSHDAAENQQFAIAVSNVQQAQVATVVVERKQNGVWQAVAGPTMVQPLSLQSFNLPAFNALYEKQRSLPDGPELRALAARHPGAIVGPGAR